MRMFIAHKNSTLYSALQTTLLGQGIMLVGESEDWPATVTSVEAARPDLLIIDWDILENVAVKILDGVRSSMPADSKIILVSDENDRQHAALSSGADLFISKNTTPDRFVELLHGAINGLDKA